MCLPKAWAFPLCPMLLAGGPHIDVGGFGGGLVTPACIVGQAECRAVFWKAGSELVQGGAAGLTTHQISLRSSAQMARWQVSSFCNLLCGLLKGCF